MSKSSIQTAPVETSGFAAAPTANGAPPLLPTENKVEPAFNYFDPIRRILKPVASLRLTVVLFALSIFLIFSGTLAQMDAGIGTVVKEYFRSLYVWIPLQLFVRFGQVFFGVPPLTRVTGSILFPGGWLIGGLLLINLVAAHVTRFRVSGKRAGVLILHAGVLVLMVGELLTGLFAVEGQMTIPAGTTTNIIKYREIPEFSVIGPMESAPDEVTVISGKRLRKGGLIQDDQLPFDVQVDEYMPNSQVADAPLEYSVPEGWRASDDLVKNGIRRDAVFQVGTGSQTAEISITSAGGGLKANIDRWRRQLGLKPLNEEDFDKEVKSFEVAGNRAFYVDLSGSGESEQSRLLGVAMTRHYQSCFIVMRGPADCVSQHKASFEAFLKSMRVQSRATEGDGVGLVAEEAREGAGVDADQRIDLASAFVTLKKKGSGESLGTYLVSEWLSELSLIDRPGQKVDVDGKTYAIALRYKRAYTPYSFQLLEFHHDLYPGTDIPNNFSSQVRVYDPDRNVDRQVNIHMNVPLRYSRSTFYQWWQMLSAGEETYYQQGFLPNDTGTILQVVRNPGSAAPYLACCMVGLGMVVHFVITLIGFLQKRRLSGTSRFQLDGGSWHYSWGFALDGMAACLVFLLYMFGYYLVAAVGFIAVYAAALILLHRASRTIASAEKPKGFARHFPWLMTAAAVVLVVVVMIPPAEDANKAHLQEFAALPVQADGRVKPLDTVARVTLASISTEQSFRDGKKVSHSAIEWLADVMTYYPECLAEILTKSSRHSPHDYAVFRIENDQLLTELGLQRREGLRYSYKEFAAKLPKLMVDAKAARDVQEKDRTLYQKHVVELARKVTAYVEVAELEAPRLIPPDNPQPNSDWLTLPQAIEELKAGHKNEATIALIKMIDAYGQDNAKEFNENLKTYSSLIATKLPTETTKAELETFFNNFAPFFVCMPIYVAVFLMAAFSWIGWSRPLNRAAFWLACLALVIHTFGLATRMYLQGRPPVTNLYSSAVFIGWMSVLLGLALEVIFELGIGNALAGALGFAGVLIAHNLSTGDTLEMMRAVLDTNFWLATHVVCISIGYSATMLAGFLGIFYILAGVFTRNEDGPRSQLAVTAVLMVVGWFVGVLAMVIARGRIYKALAMMLYGTICFATLFSFVGTVLGGIWADQSWGRFWGWDPKENGALLIVVMNALILHARWGGLVKDRGVAVLSVFGNIITGWSWFGTNQLGVGLHSYGFTSGLALTLTLFWGSQLLIVAIGLVPMRYWRGANDIKASSVAASRGDLGGLPA